MKSMRGVIARARALISFKHHPLIFAIGERTPCLSVSFESYYHRKNLGAMGLFGLERFCIDHDGFLGDDLHARFDELLSSSGAIRADLAPRLDAARAAQDRFFADCVHAVGLDEPTCTTLKGKG